MPEPSAVSRVGKHPAVFFQCVDKVVFTAAVHDPFRDRAGHHGIVRITAAVPEQGKIFCLDIVPFIDGTDDVSDDCS